MKFFVIFACIVLARARMLNRNNCNGVIVDGINHEKEVLKEGLDKPYQLSIDYNTNILYFSYTESSTRETIFKMAYLNLKTNEFGTITGINGPFASTVEEKSHKVYFGGSDGIYQLQGINEARNLDVTELNIWQLFQKDGIYFTTYPDEEAYLYKDGEVNRVTEIGNTKAILIAKDNDNNIFFSNSSGLFKHNNDGTKILGDYTLNGFTTNIDGKLFFSTPTGMFKIDDKTHEIKRMATKINIYGMAIESDGSIIYAEDDAIVRLKSTGQECFINQL